MKLFRTSIGLLLLSGLTACSTPVVKQEPVDWSQQQQILAGIQQWEMSGRISIQTESNGGQADFIWQQRNATDYMIRLQAPLGAGTTWLYGTAEGVELKNSSGEVAYDTDADRLLMQLNGWSLPVNGLRYWVRGIPASKTRYEVTKWHHNSLPEVIEQDGWRIEFREHQRIGERMLPRKLFISRLDDQEVDVRMVIRQWGL